MGRRASSLPVTPIRDFSQFSTPRRWQQVLDAGLAAFDLNDDLLRQMNSAMSNRD